MYLLLLSIVAQIRLQPHRLYRLVAGRQSLLGKLLSDHVLQELVTSVVERSRFAELAFVYRNIK
jgi:hypothetical protein